MSAEVRLAAVLAHPDDESRIVGGTLALAASRGCAVSLYCATRGEAGDDRSTPEETAAVREDELCAATAILGVADVWLDAFPDGDLGAVDADTVVERVVRFLRRTRPHAVLTFGPDGRTGHPDHVAVGRLAEVAFAEAGDPRHHREHAGEGLEPWQPGWLYHTAVARSIAERIGWTGPALGEEQLLAIDVSAVLDRKKRAAVEAHASQWALSPMNLAGGWQAWSVEHVRLAAAAPEAVGTDPLAALAT